MSVPAEPNAKSFLSLNALSPSDCEALFQRALGFATAYNAQSSGAIQHKVSLKSSQIEGPCGNQNSVISLVFFENSTRTRMSFELAAKRLGYNTQVFEAGGNTSSLAKGETLMDTCLNILAMGSRAMVLRAPDDFPMDQLALDYSRLRRLHNLTKLEAPVIFNAGWGKRGHPSQALLDILTLYSERPLSGLKFLVLGDILHSRVAASHFEICQKLNIQLAVCGPGELIPENLSEQGILVFTKMDDALAWADAVMVLRLQTERLGNMGIDKQRAVELVQAYQLNSQALKVFNKEGLILHPGPVCHGVEMAAEVFYDPRARVLKQVELGVYLRMALLEKYLV